MSKSRHAALWSGLLLAASQHVHAAPSAGDLLVTDTFADALLQVDPGSGDRTVLSSSGTGTGTNLASPDGVAVAADGTIYVANGLAGHVLSIDPATGDRSSVASTGGVVTGLAVAPSGVLYANDSFQNAVYRIDPVGNSAILLSGGTNAPSTMGAGPDLTSPDGIAVATDGTVYVAEGLDGSVLSIDPTNGDRTVVSAGTNSTHPTVGSGPDLLAITDIVVEASGNLLVNDIFRDALVRIDPANGNRTVVASDTVPDATNAFVNSDGLTLSGAAAITAEALDEALLSVDVATGTRTLQSAAAGAFGARGAGAAFSVPAKLATFPAIVVPAPEIELAFGGVDIPDGDMMPTAAKGTDFGSVPVGTNSADRVFTITNSGTADLTLDASSLATSLSGTAFSVQSPISPTTVNPAGTASFSLRFSPTAAGAANVTASFTSNDGDESPYTFALTGTGTVGDTVPPVLQNLPSDIALTTSTGSETATWAPPTATDNIDPAPTVTRVAGPAPGSSFGLGTTVISYQATDAAGNMSPVASFTVTVTVTPGETVTVLAKGETAPGTGQPFSGFNSAFLAPTGQILVEGEVATAPGLWVGAPGGVSLVALTGTTVPPGAPAGSNLSGLDRWHLGESGDVTYRGRLSTSPAIEGVWSSKSGAAAEVGIVGNAAPGTAATFSKLPIEGQVITGSGEVVFTASLDKVGGITTSTDTGIWSDAGGLLLQEGSPAASIGGGVLHAQIKNQIGANDAGAVTFVSNLRGPGVSSANNLALFAGPLPGAPAAVARRGDPAPTGATGPADFHLFLDDQSINSGGDVIFSVRLAGAGVSTTNDIGLFTDAGGPLAMIAREGQDAPGFAPGETFAEFDDLFVCDDDTCYFSARITGGSPVLTSTQDHAIFRWSPGGATTLLAAEGMVAPGTAGTFKNLSTLFTAGAAGNAAFTGILLGGVGGVTNANDEGIWTAKAGQAPALLLRDSDPFDVAGATETVKRASISESPDGGTGGRSSSVAGENIAVVITYDNGSSQGIFVRGLP